MYKYIGTNNQSQAHFTAKQYNNFIYKGESSKLKKYYQDCNPTESIVRKDDGGLINGWNLQGVLLLTRHGDRGPMTHVRGINSVNCGNENLSIMSEVKIRPTLPLPYFFKNIIICVFS